MPSGCVSPLATQQARRACVDGFATTPWPNSLGVYAAQPGPVNRSAFAASDSGDGKSAHRFAKGRTFLKTA
jgi:hypothetical protein